MTQFKAGNSIIERAKQVGFRRAALEAGATISDGPVPTPFERGWGKAAFVGSGRGVAHYWTADRSHDLPDEAYGLRSACGVLTVATERVPLFGPGNYPYCVRCENKLMGSAKWAPDQLGASPVGEMG